jgi:fructokinase
MCSTSIRLGIDLGGTKTEILAMGSRGEELWRKRLPTARDYDGTLDVIADLVREAETRTGQRGSVGMAIPGCETADGTVKNANSVWLNGRPLRADLGKMLDRDVRLANDANCFVLSEASDGAAAGAGVVFGVIAGTGLGGGVVVHGTVIGGAHGIGGEWGHIPLPVMTEDEHADSRLCYCGKRDCLETWCSGPFLEREFARRTGRALPLAEIVRTDGPAERALLDRWIDRLARGLATMVNILDPDAIVIGGGLSNIDRLYRDLPPLVERYGFNLGGPPHIVKNMHGDSSGVRGAAWLWPAPNASSA